MSTLICKKTMETEFVNSILKASITDVVSVLENHNITVLKKEVITLLKKQLDSLLPSIKSGEEIGVEYKRRLAFYTNYSLYQLMKLAEVTSTFNFDQVKVDFYEFLFTKLSVDVIEELKALNAVDSEDYNVVTFFESFKNVLVDLEDTIDGVYNENTLASLTLGTTLQELKGFVQFNNIPLPRRLKKNELKELIIFTMQRREMAISDELYNTLDVLRIQNLETLAEEYRLPCRIELRKNGVYEFILNTKSKQVGHIVNLGKYSNITEELLDTVDPEVLDLLIHAEKTEREEQPDLIIASLPEEIEEIKKDEVDRPTQDSFDRSIDEDYTIKFDEAKEAMAGLAPIISQSSALLKEESIDEKLSVISDSKEQVITVPSLQAMSDGEFDIATEMNTSVVIANTSTVVAKNDEILDRIEDITEKIEHDLNAATITNVEVPVVEATPQVDVQTITQIKIKEVNIEALLEKTLKYFGVYVLISVSLFFINLTGAITSLAAFNIGNVRPFALLEFTAAFGETVMNFVKAVLKIIGIG